MDPLYERWDQLRQSKKTLSKSLTDLKDTKSDVTKAMDEADEEIETWEGLQEVSVLATSSILGRSGDPRCLQFLSPSILLARVGCVD